MYQFLPWAGAHDFVSLSWTSLWFYLENISSGSGVDDTSDCALFFHQTCFLVLIAINRELVAVTSSFTTLTMEHCSDHDLNRNFSSFPLMFRWIISLALMSMCAFAVRRNGLPRMSGVCVNPNIQHHKVDWDNAVFDSYGNVFCYGRQVMDWLIS